MNKQKTIVYVRERRIWNQRSWRVQAKITNAANEKKTQLSLFKAKVEMVKKTATSLIYFTQTTVRDELIYLRTMKPVCRM